MNQRSFDRVRNSSSDNPKSKSGPADQNRKWVGCLAILVLLAGWVRLASAQQPKKIARIGYLTTNSSSAELLRLDPFRQGLRALGHVEGQNIVIEFRHTDGKFEQLPDIAAELVRLRVDVFVAISTNAALAAKNATRTIPIAIFGVADPVAAGLIDSLARPGGNITGFTEISEVLAGKRLELLKETVPKLSRVAVLWDPRDTGSAQVWKESQLPARELGLQLHSMVVRSQTDLEEAFKGATKARSAALAVAQSGVVNSNLKLIADMATKNRLPAIYHRGVFVESGGLMSYGADQAEQDKRVAVMIDKILKGTKPADIPVEQPMKFEMVINLKTAKTLGLTIPPIVLMRATRVVK